MLDNLEVGIGCICVLLGALLLYDGLSGPDVFQTFRVIVGAVFLTFGLFTVWLVVKSKLKARRNYKKHMLGKD